MRSVRAGRALLPARAGTRTELGEPPCLASRVRAAVVHTRWSLGGVRSSICENSMKVGVVASRRPHLAGVDVQAAINSGAVAAVLELLASTRPAHWVAARACSDRRLLVDRQHQRLGASSGHRRRSPARRTRERRGESTSSARVRLEIQIGQDPPDLRRRDPHVVNVAASRCDHCASTSRCPVTVHDPQPIVMAIDPRPARPRTVHQPRQPLARSRATPDVCLLDLTARDDVRTMRHNTSVPACRTLRLCGRTGVQSGAPRR